MDTDALRQSLQAIATGANDALAALNDPDPEPVVELVAPPDFHAQQLERIEAQAAATVQVIEAEAAADVARIEAAADAAEVVDDDDDDDDAGGDELPEVVADVDDTLDDALDELLDPADVDAAGDIDSAGDAAGEAVDVLDALPVVDPVDVAADVAPAPQHWYTRRLWSWR